MCGILDTGGAGGNWRPGGNGGAMEELEEFGLQELAVIGREFFQVRKHFSVLVCRRYGWLVGTVNTATVETAPS